MIFSIYLPLLALAMFVASALLWLMARLLTRDTQSFLSTALHAQGLVTELHWRTSRRGAEVGTCAYPDVQTDAYPDVEKHAYLEIAFTLPDCQQIRAATRTGNLHPPAKVGEWVNILYNPDNPQDMDLESRARRTWRKAGYCFLAVVFAAMGMGTLALWWILFRVWGISI